ncbi:hypothetical protein NCL57_005011 [Salmonella enterica]|nr:hypothetical protein [Salmonella enterica]EJH1055024.1 hypothetical protein [Salmonella enterica]
MYSKPTKDKVKRLTPRSLSSQEMSRNQTIHEALKEALVSELKQTGSLGHKGRIVSTKAPRLKVRLISS